VPDLSQLDSEFIDSSHPSFISLFCLLSPNLWWKRLPYHFTWKHGVTIMLFPFTAEQPRHNIISRPILLLKPFTYHSSSASANPYCHFRLQDLDHIWAVEIFWMNNMTIIKLVFWYIMKNYADLTVCYPIRFILASADNAHLDLHNSSYHTQHHPISITINAYSDIDVPPVIWFQLFPIWRTKQWLFSPLRETNLSSARQSHLLCSRLTESGSLDRFINVSFFVTEYLARFAASLKS